TVENAVTFYTTKAFANSPAGGGTAIPVTGAHIDNIANFLRVLNAAFNNAISIQRNTAALGLENSSSTTGTCPAPTADASTKCVDTTDVNGKRQTVNMLLALSNSEAADAIEDLQTKGIHAD